MDKKHIITALEEAKKNSKERKFTQRVEAIINLKDLNLKKPEDQVDVFVQLPHNSGKATTVCGLVGGELSESSKKNLDGTITTEEFAKYKDKKDIKKLGQQYKWFIAQANIMPQVAKTFGRVLGQQGKLPNPKAGCVVPPNADLKAVKEKLQKTVRATAKMDHAIKCPVGNEKMSNEEIADNVIALYNRVKNSLPKEEHNIKGLLVKLTMGAPIVVSKK